MSTFGGKQGAAKTLVERAAAARDPRDIVGWMLIVRWTTAVHDSSHTLVALHACMQV
jgi:hypothetical protein